MAPGNDSTMFYDEDSNVAKAPVPKDYSCLRWSLEKALSLQEVKQQVDLLKGWAGAIAAMAVGDPRPLHAVMQCCNSKYISRMVNALSPFQSLQSLELVMAVAKESHLSKLGKGLGKLPGPLQHLALTLKPHGNNPPTSFEGLLTEAEACFSGLRGLRLLTYESLAGQLEAVVAICSQISSLEASVSSRPDCSLAFLAELERLKHLLLLGAIDSTGVMNTTSCLAAALPVLPNLVSGGGCFTYEQVCTLGNKMPGVKHLALDLLLGTPPGTSAHTLPPDFYDQVLGPLCTKTGLSHLSLHVYMLTMTASGVKTVEVPVSLGEVVAYMQHLQHLELLPAPNGKLGLEQLVCPHWQGISSLVLGPTANPCITSSSGNSPVGTVLDLGIFKACPDLVTLAIRHLVKVQRPADLAAAVGCLTALRNLYVSGPPAARGQRDLG
jgi:hypothetical protein